MVSGTTTLEMLVLQVTQCSFLSLVVLDKVEGVQRIVIDADPGLDDILSIFVALGDPEIEVLAITLVRGNTEMTNVINNTLHALNVAGKLSIPVFGGARHGLVESPPSDFYYGTNGLADVSLPKLNIHKKLEKEPAAIYLANIVSDITIMALGPLTNVALAIHLNPSFLCQARRVIALEGSVSGVGNVRPGVEFNSYADAAASSFVFDQALASSRLLTLVPWETVIEHDLGWDWRWNILAKINNPVVSFLNPLERVQQQRRPEVRYTPPDIYPLGVVLSEHYVIGAESLYATVEYRGQKTQGVVLVDYTNITFKAANVNIIRKVNTSILRKRIYDNLSNFKKM